MWLAELRNSISMDHWLVGRFIRERVTGECESDLWQGDWLMSTFHDCTGVGNMGACHWLVSPKHRDFVDDVFSGRFRIS